MNMNKTFNKYATYEIEKDICKYRLELSKIPTIDDAAIIQDELKEGIFKWGDKGDYLVSPMSVTILNHFLVVYYNLAKHQSFSVLKDYSLGDKLKYFHSLLTIFEEYNTTKFVLDKLNFVLDPYEEKVKIIFFETPTLKVYEAPKNEIEFLKEMIITTFTIQDTLIGKPRRADFLEPSEMNIRFVEHLLQLNTLEDIYFLLEKTELETEASTPTNITNETVKKSKKIKSEKKVTQKKVNSNEYRNKNIKAKQPKNKKNDVGIFVMIGVLAVVIIGYFIFESSLSGSNKEASSNAHLIPVEETFLSNTVENNILKAYQFVFKKDYESAYNLLNAMDSVTVDDITLLIDVYVKNNKSAELLGKHPNLGNEFISYLIENNRIESINNLFENATTNNPYVLFELAALSNEHEQVISLSKEIELNARSESQVVTSYLALNQNKEALEFANKTKNPDLIKRVADTLKN